MECRLVVAVVEALIGDAVAPHTNSKKGTDAAH